MGAWGKGSSTVISSLLDRLTSLILDLTRHAGISKVDAQVDCITLLTGKWHQPSPRGASSGTFRHPPRDDDPGFFHSVTPEGRDGLAMT